MKKNLTRRDVLKTGAVGGAAVALGCGMCAPIPAQGPKGSASLPKSTAADVSRVVLIRDEKVLDAEGNVSAPVIAAMLDQGVTALLGETDADKAWARLLKPGDVLGIKSNWWKFLRTPPELEDAIRTRALKVGIKPEDIAVDDQSAFEHPVFKRATALVNARPLRTHHWSGIGSCMKNYITFEPFLSRSRWHDDSCANLAGLWEMPLVKGKTRLCIQVVLTPLFHGKGPSHFQAEYTWDYKGLLLGQDPVAVDATAVRLLEAKRQDYFKQEMPFYVPPKHVQVAASKYGLGIADPARIELVKLGWGEGALI
jgi:hypothetical protein